MPIDMPRGLPFSVDTWTSNSNGTKRHHFLTHAHKDHLVGICANSSYPIYATRLTISIILSIFPRVDESIFVEVEVGKPVGVRDPDGDFLVMAFDANHCPGAIMFLFEGEFGNVLHTGDCRLDYDCLQSLPLKYITKKGKETIFRLDYLFLDCTFARCFLAIPSKQTAIQQVINCIWKHPDAPVVYLACDLLGQEEILVEVSKTFGSKIYVDKSTNAQCLQALSLIAPKILSEDASSRFQVFGFTSLYERASMKLAEARENIQPEPLFVRPSTQWYACDENSGSQGQSKLDLSKAVRDEHGVWHVCYSMHSSREELESGLQLLQPKWVISTTPPCRAMELDYVKRHCFKTQIDSDDPLWKLLKYAHVHSKTSVPKPIAISNTSSKVCGQMPTSCIQEESLIQSKELSINSMELQMDSVACGNDGPISKQITLFGRARLGLHDRNILHEETSGTDIKAKQVAFSLEHTTVSCQVVSSDMNIIVHSVSQLQDDNMKGNHDHHSSQMQDDNMKGSHYHHSSQLQDDNMKGSHDHHSSQLQDDNMKGSHDHHSSQSQDDNMKGSHDHHSSQLQDEKRKDCCVHHSSQLQDDNRKDRDPNNTRSEEIKIEKDGSPCIGSSKGFNPSLRKFYRSMNVPVPRPLPSLTKLMDVSKRARIGY